MSTGDKPDWRPDSTDLAPEFWVGRRLATFNPAEWEALCDGCGQCCLVKLIDEDDERMYVTDVACRGYDCQNGGCAVYDRRKSVVPECIVLTPELIPHLFPKTCAYKRLNWGLDIPDWHPLKHAGDRQPMIDAGVTIAGRVVAEGDVRDADLEDHIRPWFSDAP